MRILPPILGLLLVLSSLLPTPVAHGQQVAAVDARIEIVWPHDAQGRQAPAESAPLVNVEVYLFQRGTLNPVGCDFGGTPDLHFAVNDALSDRLTGQQQGVQHADETETNKPQKLTRTVNGVTFPYWVFNDVPIAPAPGTIYVSNITTYFFVEVPGFDTRTNVWGHGADPRTFAPNQTLPQQVASAPVTPVESIIQIVYPHDRRGALQPVQQAPLANVSVNLFRHPLCATASAANPTPPCFQSEPTTFSPVPQLLASLNTGYLAPVSQPAHAVTMGGNNFVYPRYDFNDVDVAAASDPLNKYYFAVQLPGVESHTTIWTHGADPRTNFPQRDAPTGSGAGCS